MLNGRRNPPHKRWSIAGARGNRPVQEGKLIRRAQMQRLRRCRFSCRKRGCRLQGTLRAGTRMSTADCAMHRRKKKNRPPQSWRADSPSYGEVLSTMEYLWTSEYFPGRDCLFGWRLCLGGGRKKEEKRKLDDGAGAAMSIANSQVSAAREIREGNGGWVGVERASTAAWSLRFPGLQSRALA